MWINKYFPAKPFKRNADVIIVRCKGKLDGGQLLNFIKEM